MHVTRYNAFHLHLLCIMQLCNCSNSLIQITLTINIIYRIALLHNETNQLHNCIIAQFVERITTHWRLCIL